MKTLEDKRQSALLHTMKRRARKRGLPHNFTLDQWKACLEYFDNSCAYCGSLEHPLHIDHFIPIVASGGNTVNNIVPACKMCNLSKWARNPYSWIESTDTLERILAYFTEFIGQSPYTYTREGVMSPSEYELVEENKPYHDEEFCVKVSGMFLNGYTRAGLAEMFELSPNVIDLCLVAGGIDVPKVPANSSEIANLWLGGMKFKEIETKFDLNPINVRLALVKELGTHYRRAKILAGRKEKKTKERYADKIADRRRKVNDLYWNKKYSASQIADMMKVSIQTVRLDIRNREELMY